MSDTIAQTIENGDVGAAFRYWDTDQLLAMQERDGWSVRTGIDVITHSGTVKHAHHDLSAFTDDAIDTPAEIAERRTRGRA